MKTKAINSSWQYFYFYWAAPILLAMCLAIPALAEHPDDRDRGGCAGDNQSRLFDYIHDIENEFNYHYDTFVRAPMGSFEEQRAKRKVLRAMDDLDHVLRNTQELYSFRPIKLERVFDEYYQKFVSAGMGSYKENFMKKVVLFITNNFQSRWEAFLSCAYQNGRQPMFFERRAMRHYDLFVSAGMGSYKENLHKAALQSAFRYATDAYRDLRNYYPEDFFMFDGYFMDYYRQFVGAGMGSYKEKYFKDVMLAMRNAAEASLRQYGRRMHWQDLERIVEENTQRYRNASMGSYLERYADTIRRIAADLADGNYHP